VRAQLPRHNTHALLLSLIILSWKNQRSSLWVMLKTNRSIKDEICSKTIAHKLWYYYVVILLSWYRHDNQTTTIAWSEVLLFHMPKIGHLFFYVFWIYFAWFSPCYDAPIKHLENSTRSPPAHGRWNAITFWKKNTTYPNRFWTSAFLGIQRFRYSLKYNFYKRSYLRFIRIDL